MKKSITLILALSLLIVGLVGVSSTSAAIYTMTPPVSDMWGLNHQLYYTWGMNWTHTDEVITRAELIFHDIYNTPVGEENKLYTNLLDNPPIGATPGNDFGLPGNYFEGDGVLVGTWSDPGYGAPGIDLTYDLGALGLLGTLNMYASDGLFGFGFDPDCAYNNSGIELIIETMAIPEPATLILLGIGLTGAGIVSRRKSRK